MGRWYLVAGHWLTGQPWVLVALTLPQHSVFSPLPFFQQKRSSSSKGWWNCPAQQIARFREDKPGEMELGACAELRKGLVRVCGVWMARDCLWSAWGDQGA